MEGPRESHAKEPTAADANPIARLGNESQEDTRARAPERRQALRRAAYLLLSILAVALFVRAVVSKRGLLEAHRSRVELARLELDVEKWRDRNTHLETRIKALREDPAAIEAIARERLGWVRPGEVTYLFPQDPSAPEPGDTGPVPPGEFSPTIGDEQEEPAGDGTPTASKP